MSHINLEDSIARRVRHFASRFGSTELTLTGEYNVSPESGSFHFLNPDGANRTVRLPVIELGGGQLYMIVNTGTGSLNVVNNSGVAVSTLNAGRMSFYVSSASTWQAALVAQNLTPENAEYFVGALHSDLSNERLVKDSGTITWDFSVPGEAKANTVSGGGNVSNFGTPLVGQVARWVNATTIEGVSAAGVFQPVDGDLTALSNLTGSNVIYYRVGADTWDAVTIGTGLSFTTGTLTATGGGGGAPTGAEYITASSDATLSAERVLTNTATITWDFTTAGQAKASSLVGGGNVSNSGTPSAGQYGKWVTATTIQGVAVGTVLTDIGAQPLDADLTAIAALTGTNTIYYRSAVNTWTAVTIGGNLTFTGGTLAASSNVSSSGIPAVGQVALWTDATHIQGVSTTADQTTARSNIYAAPLSALAYNGLQINGGFDVSQEVGSTGIAGSGYFCDGWKYSAGAVGLVGTAAADASSIFSPVGYTNGASLTVTTAVPSLATTDGVALYTNIEGYRIARLGWGKAIAQPITIGFWTAHHRTGLYSVVVRNSGGTLRSYSTSYTQSAADVPQYNTITVPGDTAGTWPVDNTTGIVLVFEVACGTALVAPSANTWLGTTQYHGVSGQTNGIAATSDVFRLTGVTVLPGSQALTAAQSPLVMRPFGEELTICKRYYQKLGGVVAADMMLQGWSGPGASITTTFFQSPNMRTTPTVARFGTWADFNVSATNYFLSPNSIGWQISAAGATGLTSSFGNPGGLALDARL